LNIPGYAWDNECLHGYINRGPDGDRGYATVFGNSIALAATFNTKNLNRVGSIIAVEGRALNNWYRSRGVTGSHSGVNCWAPNINIARDPRWGRNQEVF
jgi:beta-glucosidase